MQIVGVYDWNWRCIWNRARILLVSPCDVTPRPQPGLACYGQFTGIYNAAVVLLAECGVN